MSWNQSSIELLTKSSGQYRSTNSGPWEETHMNQLESSKRGGINDFDSNHSIDIATGLINNGIMRDVGNRV